MTDGRNNIPGEIFGGSPEEVTPVLGERRPSGPVVFKLEKEKSNGNGNNKLRQLVTYVGVAILTMLATGVAGKACSDLSCGTWQAPYQTRQEAIESQKRAEDRFQKNDEDHMVIQGRLNSIDSKLGNISDTNRQILETVIKTKRKVKP